MSDSRDAVTPPRSDPGRVLYLSYNGLTEPLGRRQVVPYVLGLAARGWTFTVVSFEKGETDHPEERARVERLLREVGARWLTLRYHRRPPVLSTIYDAVRGAATGAGDRPRPRVVHARSTVPASMARSTKPLVGAPWIYDVRGLLAQEYVDAGHWRRGGLLHRIVTGLEERLLRDADGLVFLTERIRDELAEAGRIPTGRPVSVIPCCVDAELFRPSDGNRRRIRAELGLGDAPVVVYSGSLGSWYKVEAMLDFFAVLRKEMPGLRFLVLTRQPHVAARALRARPQIERDVILRTVEADDVPAYLAAADAGLCFLGDSPSKAASSPTKYGEYLASGLPVVTNRWTGDASSLDGEATWILIDAFEENQYRTAAKRLKTLLASRAAAVKGARSLALRHFSLERAVERYDDLYRQVGERWRWAID